MGILEGLMITSSFSVAEGGFATIYRGTLRQNGRDIPVAVKVLRGGTRVKNRETKFYREALIWKPLSHPNILQMYGVANVGPLGTLGMVCPWIGKGNLTSYLRGRPHISLPERLSFLEQIAFALKYLHSRSIVHGDLTGNNVLVEDNGNVLLCDFGLSNIQRDGDAQFHTASTLKFNAPWAAPEVIFSYEYPDVTGATKASDVYSFGSVMLQASLPRELMHGNQLIQLLVPGFDRTATVSRKAVDTNCHLPQTRRSLPPSTPYERRIRV
ncbi:kinase-like domain-containing protein [Collybia nuda]|uniref:Kinase-like domain-containing protein n=1 Tax=Collybia nuda TaxID=64659 RepID=A0A9P6C9X0_9AGAR|nr:kinase-like domain-containing protein [Collybia nuda]